jgi:hypothetical protein
MMWFSKMTMPPFTQLELFSLGLKSMKVNFSVFPGLSQSPDFNILEPLWLVLETRMRNRFPPSTSLKQLEDALQEGLYKIPLETVQNLYESIPRRIMAVLKGKGGPTPD